MKRITCDTLNVNGLYFDCSTINIGEWIAGQLKNIRVNDPQSCEISCCEDMIYIEGDEDWHEITVEKIIPITC